MLILLFMYYFFLFFCLSFFRCHQETTWRRQRSFTSSTEICESLSFMYIWWQFISWWTIDSFFIVDIVMCTYHSNVMSIGQTNCAKTHGSTLQAHSKFLWNFLVYYGPAMLWTSNVMALPVHAGSQCSMYRSLVCLLFTFNWASTIAIVKDYKVNVNESRPNGQIASNLVLSNRRFRKLKPFWFFLSCMLL